VGPAEQGVPAYANGRCGNKVQDARSVHMRRMLLDVKALTRSSFLKLFLILLGMCEMKLCSGTAQTTPQPTCELCCCTGKDVE
jgi:hypothetical protein